MRQNEILKELRKKFNLTLEGLAAETGISRNMLWHLEKGDRTGTIETLEKLCDFYNVSLDYITGNSKRREIIDNWIDELIECGILKDQHDIPIEIQEKLLQMIRDKLKHKLSSK